MINIIHVRSYSRKKPGPTADYIATTKALAGFVLSERERNAFVSNVLSMELAEKLAEPLDELEMPDNQRERIKESF